MANAQAPSPKNGDSLSDWGPLFELVKNQKVKCLKCSNFIKINTICQTCEEKRKEQAAEPLLETDKDSDSSYDHISLEHLGASSSSASSEADYEFLADSGPANPILVPEEEAEPLLTPRDSPIPVDCNGNSSSFAVPQPAKPLLVPCRNECGRFMHPEDLQDHLDGGKAYEECEVPGCHWREQLADCQAMGKHVIEAHGISENMPFAVDFSRESFLDYKVLMKNDSMYTVRIERPLNSEYVFYNVFRAEKDNVHTVSFFHFIDGDINNAYRKVILTEDKEMNTESERAVYTMHLDLLRNIYAECGKKKMAVSVVVADSDKEQALRCSACSKIMRLPIYQCVGRHRVCEICRSLSTGCPVCRRLLVVLNPFVEKLTFDVYYPCMYRTSGCKARELGHEIDHHEFNCPKKFHVCPLNCSFKNRSIEQFKKHIKLAHPTVWIGSVVPIGTNLDSPRSFSVFFDKCLFQVEYHCITLKSVVCPYGYRNEYKLNVAIKLLNGSKLHRYFCSLKFWDSEGYLKEEHDVFITSNLIGGLTIPSLIATGGHPGEHPNLCLKFGTVH